MTTIGNYKADHSDQLISDRQTEFVTTNLDFHDYVLSSSILGRAVRSSPNQVEHITIRVGPDAKPVSVSTTLKSALGAPLFTASIVDVIGPVIAGGPILSDSEKKPRRETAATSEEEEPQEEEPSFLRKYWWVLVGGMLLTSMFGPKEEPAQAAAPAVPSSSSASR